MTTPLDRLVAHARLPRAVTLLDAAQLSTLLGREVTITHLRIKPAHNVLVAWRDADDRHGWTEATGDDDKLTNALRRAGRLGREITVHQRGDVHVFSGDVWADRKLGGKLARALAGLPRDGLPRDGLRVLRYNPQRRLVAETADGLVMRVHTGAVEHLAETSARWQRLGVPAISMFGLAGLAVSPRWGAGDVHTLHSAAGSRLAGRALADLHRAGRETAPELDTLPTDPRAAARAVAAVAPGLTGRARELGERLAVLLPELSATEPVTELHGDLSPDQILVDTAGEEIRVIDFDRAGAGPASRDVGSYLAYCRQAGLDELGREFLAGYHAAGGAVPWVNVAAWEAHAHLTFALGPMRRGETDWPHRIERAVELAAAALEIVPPPRVDLDGECWLVNRAWADVDDALTVELKHPDTGQVRAGWWGSGGLRAHEPGEDPHLALPAGRVVSHRAGKRAVVCSEDGSRFTKVVRAGRARRIIAGLARAQVFAAGFRMPEVLAADGHTVTLAALEGRSLHTPDLFTDGEWERAWGEVTAGLQRVWREGPGEGPVHSASDEAEVLAGWVRRAVAFIDEPGKLLAAAAVAQEGLVGLPESVPVPCHRDLHSKQLLWCPAGGPGLLDVDTACRADPGLDLGNLRAHALWRERQGVWDRAGAGAVLTAIDAVPADLVDPVAVRVYERATLVRLVCVYAFRPRYRTQAMGLLGNLG